MIKNGLTFRAKTNHHTADWILSWKHASSLIFILVATFIADSYLGELYFGGSGLIALIGGLVTIFIAIFLARH